jgi:hypothetical protein
MKRKNNQNLLTKASTKNCNAQQSVAVSAFHQLKDGQEWKRLPEAEQWCHQKKLNFYKIKMTTFSKTKGKQFGMILCRIMA